MQKAIRNIVIAVVMTSVLLLVWAVPASAESWSSGLWNGLITVDSVLLDGTYTWTLTNNTSLPGDTDPSFDVLVWNISPYQVRQPLSYVAPEGWWWAGDCWAIEAGPSRKYYTPDALGPGESVTFEYTPDPEAALVNGQGPQPEGLGFIAHVGAVVPDSGSPDGSIPWIPTSTPQGRTWFERFTPVPLSSVPEPSGLLVLTFGIVGLTSRFLHRRTSC